MVNKYVLSIIVFLVLFISGCFVEEPDNTQNFEYSGGENMFSCSKDDEEFYKYEDKIYYFSQDIGFLYDNEFFYYYDLEEDVWWVVDASEERVNDTLEEVDIDLIKDSMYCMEESKDKSVFDLDEDRVVDGRSS